MPRGSETSLGKKKLGGDPDFLSVIVLFPSGTFSTRWGALSFRKLISATISVFQIKQVALMCDLNRLEAVVFPERFAG
jgi:hypothetical protein